jgi:hypothetical protein
MSAGKASTSTPSCSPLTLRLPDDQLVALADLIAERIGSKPSTSQLVDAATIAGTLGVARSWVYANANALGGQRIGNGSKPRLRFDLATAQAAFTTAEPEQAQRPPARRRRRSSSPHVGSILRARP